MTIPDHVRAGALVAQLPGVRDAAGKVNNVKRFYIGVPSWGPSYCSEKQYAIEIADDENIVGVNHGHWMVVVVAKAGSHHGVRGMLPQAVPLHQVFPERFAREYTKPLSVFEWTEKYNCLVPGAVLCSRDGRATTPILARARTEVTFDTEENPSVSDYEWTALPLVDLDPDLTGMEQAVRLLIGGED